MLENWLKSRKVNTTSSIGRAASVGSVIGLHMVIATFFGLGFGYFLDKFFNTSPWLTIIFLLLGIAAGFKNLITEARKLMDHQDRMDKKQPAESLKSSRGQLDNTTNSSKK